MGSANDPHRAHGTAHDSAARSNDSAARAGATRAINAARANDGLGGRNGESRDGGEFSERENRKSGKGGPAFH
jgi:hypothetical protein